MNRSLVFIAVIVSCTMPLLAQAPGCSPVESNADLTVNGVRPDVGTNRISVTASDPFTVEVTSSLGPGLGVILLASAAPVSCAGFPLPWGGSIDLDGFVVLADGINYSVTGPTGLDLFARTPFSISGVAPAAAGFAGSLQAFVEDPTNSVFPVRTSVAAEIVVSKRTTYMLGDDGFVEHVLSVQTLDLYGVTRTSVFLGANGLITFDGGSNQYQESAAGFAGGAGTGGPIVGLYWSDLNAGGFGSGATYEVTEDPINGVVEVAYLNQNHWSTGSPAGDFKVSFGSMGPNSLTFDHSGFIPGTDPTDNGIIGVSNGNTGLGQNVDLSNGLGTGFGLVQGAYTTSGPNESIFEVIPANTAIGTNGGIMTLVDPLGTGSFSIQ